jgi:hypothetical protein
MALLIQVDKPSQLQLTQVHCKKLVTPLTDGAQHSLLQVPRVQAFLVHRAQLHQLFLFRQAQPCTRFGPPLRKQLPTATTRALALSLIQLATLEQRFLSVLGRSFHAAVTRFLDGIPLQVEVELATR